MLICRLQLCEVVLLPELDQQDGILWLIAGGFYFSIVVAKGTTLRAVTLLLFTSLDSHKAEKQCLPHHTQLPAWLFCLRTPTHGINRQRICTHNTE